MDAASPLRTYHSDHLLFERGNVALRIWGLTAVALLIIGSSLAWTSYDEYGKTLELEYRFLETHARFGDAQVAGSLRSIDLLLQNVIDDTGSTPALPADLVQRHQLDKLRQFPEIRTLVTTDNKGQVTTAESLTDPTAAIETRKFNAFQREYFTVHRDAKPEDYYRYQISRPFKTITNLNTISVSRAIRGKNGKFLGVALASLSPTYFDSVLQQVLANNEVDAAAVHNRFGDVIYRLPDPEKYVGANIAGGPAFKSYLSSNQQLTRYLGITATDGVKRILVFSKVEDTGLDVGVSAKFDVVMAGWRSNSLLKGLIFVAVAGLSLALALVSQRRLSERRRSEEALLESEFRWKFAIEGAGDGVWDWNIQTDQVDYSKRWKEMLGYADVDVLPTNHEWVTRIHPDDQAYVADTMQAYLDGKTAIYVVEYRLRCKDESYKWILGRGMVVSRSEDGTPLRMIGTHTDITQHKKAEEATQAASQYSRSLIEASLDPLVTISAEGKVTDVNKATEEVTGVSRDNLIGSDFADYFTEPQKAREGYQQVFSQGSATDYPLAIRHASGKVTDVLYNASVYRDAQGKVLGVFAAARDITERKKAEDARRESEEKLQAVFNVADIGVSITDRNGKYVMFNNWWSKHLGYDREEIQNLRNTDITHPDDIEESRTWFFKIIEGKVERYRLEKRFVRKDQSVFWGDLSVSPIRDRTSNSITNVVGMVTDITERKQAEKALEISRRLSEEAEQIGKVGGWEVDVSTGKQTWTEETYRIHEVGLDYEPTVEKGINFYTPESRPTIELAVRKAIAHGEPFDVELEIITAKGNLRSVHAIGKADIQHGRIHGFFQDITERKQVGMALREAYESLCSILETTLDGFWRVDRQGCLLDVNPTYCQQSGYTREELLGMRISDLEAKETAAETAKHIQTVIKSSGDQFESRHRRKDGSVWDVEVSTTYRNTDGGHFFVFLRDITERRQAEKNRMRLMAHLESSPDFAGFANAANSLIQYINRAGRAMTGVGDSEDVTRLKIADVHPDWVNQLFEDEILPIAIREGAWQGECAFLHRDGHEVPVSMVLTAHKDSNGVVEAFSTISRDISERKQLEAELAQHRNHLEELVFTRTAELAQAKEDAETSEHFMQVITDGIPGMIAYCNPDLRYEFANKAYQDWFGKSAAEISGTHLRDVLDEDLFQKNLPFFNAALRGEPQVFQRTLLNPEGKPAYKWVSYLPDFKAEQVQGFFVLVSDITELRNTQLQLEQLNEQLQLRTVQAEAANRTKSIFLSNMSHELRTPMNGVMGMIDLVLRRATDPQQIDWLNKSKRSAKHLLEVINDILDISKIESERLILEEMNFSLPQTIDEVLQMQEAPAQAKGLRLSREISPSLPDVLCGDAMRLRQILLNFIGNAIKFSERGEITVSVRAEAEDKHSVLLRLEVTDQGIGISAEQQDMLFHAFTQADGSMNRKYGGTGLGLIISKRMALLMGGDAGVISEQGSGSTFWATVRLRKDTKVVATPSPEKVDAETLIGQRYCGHRILVVDDEPINLEVSRLQLEAVDLVVDTVEDGAEAVAKARTNSYAAIFMDMQMPKLNGLEATQQIRQMPGYRHTPIIAMTANAFAEDKAKCLEVGMNDFLIKPFNPDEMFAVLLRSLSQSEG